MFEVADSLLLKGRHAGLGLSLGSRSISREVRSHKLLARADRDIDLRHEGAPVHFAGNKDLGSRAVRQAARNRPKRHLDHIRVTTPAVGTLSYAKSDLTTRHVAIFVPPGCAPS